MGLDAAAIPYHAIAFTRGTESRQKHPFPHAARWETPYDVNVICLNPPELRLFAKQAPPGFFEGRYTIGSWWWELAYFPPEMRDGFRLVDEVWVGSRFAADSIGRATEKPVTVVPLPVSPPGANMSREMLGLPQGFMFLFMFDYFSVFERKNPLAVVEAFVRGFSSEEPVSLVIKSINGDKNPPGPEQLKPPQHGIRTFA